MIFGMTCVGRKTVTRVAERMVLHEMLLMLKIEGQMNRFKLDFWFDSIYAKNPFTTSECSADTSFPK